MTEVHGLTERDGDVPAVDDLRLGVEPGEVAVGCAGGALLLGGLRLLRDDVDR